jgi:DNA-binding transcriptional MerR regulator
MPVIDNCYYTEREAAKELQIKVETLRHWASRRKGPPRTVVARKPVYKIDDFLHWMDSKKRTFEPIE